METAATKTAGACLPKIHSETKHVLKNTFPTAVDAAKKDLKDEWKDFETKLKKLKVDDVLTDRTWKVLFQQYAKKRLIEENVNFLINYSKKDASIYNEYIAVGSRQEINIDHALRVEFDTAEQNGQLRGAPWDKAANAIKTLLSTNDLSTGKFADFVLE